jgi:hypothetical protein
MQSFSRFSVRDLRFLLAGQPLPLGYNSHQVVTRIAAKSRMPDR